MDSGPHQVAFAECHRSQAVRTNHLQSSKSHLLQSAPSCAHHRTKHASISNVLKPKNDKRKKETYGDASWNRLVWVSILVSWKTRSVRVTELATGSSTPRVEMSIAQYCDCVGLSTRYFLDLHLLQGDNQLWFGLVRAAIFVFGH